MRLLACAPLVLGVGASDFLPARQTSTVRVASGKIIKVTDAGRTIKVVGKAAGSTFIELDHQRCLVTVLKSEPFRTYQKLKALTKKMLDLEVEIHDGLPVVRGHLHRFIDWQKLSQAGPPASLSFLFAARIDEDLLSDVDQFFQNQLSLRGLPRTDIRFHSDPAVIIAKDLKSENILWQRIFSPFGLRVQFVNSQVALTPLVQVKIVIAEVSRHFSQELGLNWEHVLNARLLPATNLEGTLTATLRALEENGEGQILASPKLLARSGGKAEFLAGGEFPIKVMNRFTRDIIWKKYGVSLAIKPEADFSGRMAIELTTEVSSLDHSNTVDGLPALKSNRVSSHFNLRSSQTIALSGLIKNDWGREANGLPLLNQVPILGRLFSSQRFREDKSELVIFVTPEILDDNRSP